MAIELRGPFQQNHIMIIVKIEMLSKVVRCIFWGNCHPLLP